MALQTTALDRMFEQVTAKRRGRKDPRRPHGTAGVKRGNTTLTGTRALVRDAVQQQTDAKLVRIDRGSCYASSKLDRLAGRV